MVAQASNCRTNTMMGGLVIVDKLQREMFLDKTGVRVPDSGGMMRTYRASDRDRNNQF